MSLTETSVRTALQQFCDPYLQQDYISCHALKLLQIHDQHVKLAITVGYPLAYSKNSLIAQLQRHLHQTVGDYIWEIEYSSHIDSHFPPSSAPPVKSIKNVIAVASGKGGVGKSTTAVNLAVALAQEGASVGILDADIYGPNQPQLLGVQGQPEVNGPTGLRPLVRHGIQSISMGYLVAAETPMVWRGPMVSQALQQLLHQTEWQALDYLVIDLPPGTGDIQLTMAQKIPVTGGVIVTTPQIMSLLDAHKGLAMFRKVNIPVLGIIENMSGHVCTQCGHQEAIFGSEGAAKLAETTDSELLGHLPLDKSIRENADNGIPSVIAAPDSKIANLYRNIALRIAAKIALQPKSFANKFPKITVE